MDMQNKNIFLISYNYLVFFSIRIQTWVFPSSYTLVVVYFESVRNLELQPTRRNGRAHVGPRQWSSLQIAIGEWNTVVPSHDSPFWILVFLVTIVRRITRSIKSVTFLNNCYMITQLRVWKSEIFNCKRTTLWFAHLEKFSLHFSSFANIRVNLLHLCYFMVLLYWCFSILAYYYFQVSFKFKIILWAAKIT